jgi:hypothetical protein
MNSYLPYDVEILIYRYVHELYMIDIRKEINNINQNDILIINYIKLVLYPYIFWNRIIKIKTTNKYYNTVIDRYVNKKRMFRVFREMNEYHIGKSNVKM